MQFIRRRGNVQNLPKFAQKSGCAGVYVTLTVRANLAELEEYLVTFYLLERILELFLPLRGISRIGISPDCQQTM